MLRYIITLMIAISLAGDVRAGMVSYKLCQAGCAGIVVPCFGAAGFVHGTVPGAQIATIPALAACNKAFGGCYKACAITQLIPFI